MQFTKKQASLHALFNIMSNICTVLIHMQTIPEPHHRVSHSAININNIQRVKTQNTARKNSHSVASKKDSLILRQYSSHIEISYHANIEAHWRATKRELCKYYFLEVFFFNRRKKYKRLYPDIAIFSVWNQTIHWVCTSICMHAIRGITREQELER